MGRFILRLLDGGRRTAPVGASGLRGAEQDLCPRPKERAKTGLREGRRAGIMEESDLHPKAPPYSAKRRETEGINFQ